MRHFRELQNLHENVNIEYINKYLIFCNTKNSPENYEVIHHLLPRAHFPEYADLINNSWNAVYLSNYDHYIAHALLFKALNTLAMGTAWYYMNNVRVGNNIGKGLIGPNLYEELIISRNTKISEHNRGKVVCRNIETDEVIKVSKEEFDSNDILIGVTKGSGGEHLKNTVGVIRDGEYIRIDKCDILEQDVYHTFGVGKFVGVDKDGKRVIISTDDERYLSGEITSVRKGAKLNIKTRALISKKAKEQKRFVGKNNPHARKIVLYDNNDIIVFESHGDLKEKLEDVGLNYNTAYRALRLGVKIKSKKAIDFNGWYLKYKE